MSIRRTLLRLLAFTAAAVLALVLFLSRDKAPPAYDPGAPQSVLGVPIGAVRNAVAIRLDSVARPTWVTPDRWKRVRAVYAVWSNAPLWIEPAGLKERATALLKVLEEAPDHALRTDGYPLDSIRTLVNADQLEANPTAARLADVDVLLTAAYVGYGTDMLMGQVDPKTISQAWHIPEPLAEVDSALIRTLQNPVIAQGLADMAPKDSAYTVLKSEYARYRQMVADGGWALIPVARGDREAAVLARLRAERLPVDSVAGDPPTVIRLYQERHGLAETGKLDDRTVRSMNVPATERLQQIGSNLERQRRTTGDRRRSRCASWSARSSRGVRRRFSVTPWPLSCFGPTGTSRPTSPRRSSFRSTELIYPKASRHGARTASCAFGNVRDWAMRSGS
jgi:hypothetical protein